MSLRDAWRRWTTSGRESPESKSNRPVGGAMAPDDNPRILAARLAAASRDPRRIPALAVLRTDPDPAVQKAAVAALDAIDPTWRRLPEARVAAEFELRAISSAIAPTLQKASGLLASAERIVALDRMVRERRSDAFEALGMALRDPDPVIRFRAPGWMVALGDARAIPLLETASGDVDERVRKNVVEALAHFRHAAGSATSEPPDEATTAATPLSAGPSPIASDSAPAGAESGADTSWMAIFKTDVMNFLTSDRTREYQQKTATFWSEQDLKLVVARRYSADLTPDILFQTAAAAIEELQREGRITGTPSGYRAT